MRNVKYLIIGAGISGLSFALKKKTEDYIILEKEAVAGGLCKSYEDKGFIWDVSGHFFHFHSEETKKYYNLLMKDSKQVIAKKMAKVYYNGKYIDAPFQYNIHQLPTEEFIDCLTGLYYSNKFIETNNFSEYVKYKFGNGIAEKFLIPYNEKLYACNLNCLEKDSMRDFLPDITFDKMMEKLNGTQEKTYNDYFYYPLKGTGEIINAMLNILDSNRIFLNNLVMKISVKDKIVYTSSEIYKYKYLINTIPLNSFLEMAQIKSENRLKSNQVLIFNIGFDRDSIEKNISWAYFPGSEIFYRVGFYNNITKSDKLSIYVEISFPSDKNIDIKTAYKRTLQDLTKVGIIKNHKVVGYNYIVVNPGYVHITEESKKFIEMVTKTLEMNQVYSIGRYAKWEYSAMDDSMEQAELLSQNI